jgi:hypothetical protein
MSQPKTHFTEKLDAINELLDCYTHSTKSETLAAQRGLLSGWLARLATTDYIVSQELDARLEIARQKHSSPR